jgi:hypothetical protein
LVDHHKFTIYKRGAKKLDQGQKMPSVQVNSDRYTSLLQKPYKIGKEKRKHRYIGIEYTP